jgi:hypothetical protein
VSAWVCTASVVMTAPARSSPSSRGWKAGTSPGATSTWRWRARRGWRGPSRPAGGPGGRRVWRVAASCHRPRMPVAAAAAARGGRGRKARRRSLWPGPAGPASPGPADGDFGRDAVAAEGVAAGAERGTDWLGSLGGPFGDRGQRPGTGKHRGRGHGHGHGQDGDQRAAATTRGTRVGDAGQGGEQLRSLGFLERVGIAQRSRPDGIGDDSSAGTGFHRGHEPVRTA